MANHLDGSSECSPFAPLSQAETVAIAKHVMEHVKSLASRFDGLERNVMQHVNDVQGIRCAMDAANSDLRKAGDALAATNANLESTQQDLSRSVLNVEKLGRHLDSTNDQVMTLREASRVSTTTMHKHEQDIAKLKEALAKLQSALNHVMEEDLTKIRNGMIETNYEVWTVQTGGSGSRMVTALHPAPAPFRALQHKRPTETHRWCVLLKRDRGWMN